MQHAVGDVEGTSQSTDASNQQVAMPRARCVVMTHQGKDVDHFLVRKPLYEVSDCLHDLHASIFARSLLSGAGLPSPLSK